MRKRVLLVALPIAAASLGAGTAYAYVTSSGSGTGSASTGSMQPVTVTASTGTPSSPLLPGGDGDVVLQVKNPNDFDVTLVNVTGDGTITASGGQGDCSVTGVSFADQTGLNVSIAGGGATTSVDLPQAAHMDGTSLNGCQGATFSIPVTIEVHK